MQSLSDENTFLDQLRASNTTAFELLYKTYFPSIAYMIKQNKGNDGDAEDIFQETVIVLLQKIRQPDFQLTSSLKTYLYAVARNFWLKRLRDERIIPTDNETQLAVLQHQDAFLLAEPDAEASKEEQVHAWLAKITGNCQTVLKAIFFAQEPIDQVMHTMGWKNRHTAINQKYKCIQQIKKVSESAGGAL